MGDPRRKSRLTALVLSACATFAAPLHVAAFTPVRECDVNPSDGQVYNVGEGSSTALDYSHTLVGDGVVMWAYTTGRGADASILQSCDTGRELRVVFPSDGGFEAAERFDDMVHGDASYTMRAIAAALTPLRAEVRHTRDYYGSCFCEAAGFN